MTNQDTKKCPYCAEDIKINAIVCKHCGRDLTAPVPVSQEKPKKKRGGCLRTGLAIVGVLFGLVIIVAIITPSSDKEKGESTPAVVQDLSESGDTNAASIDPALIPTATPEPTATTETTLPTATPMPPTPTPEGKLAVGTHLIGSDAEPGVYVGIGEGLMGCYWERLSGLSGEFDDIITNDNSVGLFYLEISPSDIAARSDCPLTPIDQVPARTELLTELPPGMYLVGRDIAPGLYTGEGIGEIGCYWERLSGIGGTFEEIISNDNAIGQFFVEVQPGDAALAVDCDMQRTN